MEPMHIIGGGSIGLLFSASIRGAFPSYPLSLLLRDHHKPKIDDNEVMVCLMKNGRPRMIPVPAQIISENRPRPIQNLLVTTKAYAATAAVGSVLDRLDSNGSSIILLCNGAFSVRDEIRDLLLSNDSRNVELILATTTHGAYQEQTEDEMFHVVHAGEGSTFIENQPSISQLWDQSGLFSKSISAEEMTGMLWQKLAANCAINPLTALQGCENGQLLQQSPPDNGLPSMGAIIKEISLIATKACGSKALQLNLTYDSLQPFVSQVIENTFHNRSSMLQDVTKQQRTEIKYLNGYVAQMGVDLGIDTPANNELCRRIKELEEGFEN